MPTKLEEGVELEEFDDDPPMQFIGKVDGKWFGLFWHENTWIFSIAHHKEHLYVNRDFCLWFKNSPYPALRPSKGSGTLVGEVKAVIHACVQEWRTMLAQNR